MLLKELGHSVKAQPSPTSFILKLPEPESLGVGEPAVVSKLSRALRSIHAEGTLGNRCLEPLEPLERLLLGAQVCLLDLETGDVLADLALGHSSWLNPQPVTRDTMFNILEISKMFLAFSAPWTPQFSSRFGLL